MFLRHAADAPGSVVAAGPQPRMTYMGRTGPVEQMFESRGARSNPHNPGSRHGQGRNRDRPSPLVATSNPQGGRVMRSILYVIGVVVVILVLLSFLQSA
jgi:hypothetical protein